MLGLSEQGRPVVRLQGTGGRRLAFVNRLQCTPGVLNDQRRIGTHSPRGRNSRDNFGHGQGNEPAKELQQCVSLRVCTRCRTISQVMRPQRRSLVVPMSAGERRATDIVKNETTIHPTDITPGPPVARPKLKRVVIPVTTVVNGREAAKHRQQSLFEM